ncbi:MAG TPA: hypothetical protein VKA26_00310 [Ignavibacteriaceae bacterium]|nr:hypothetical protein [Ignavibacteriaceae bacterium]
MWDTEERYSFYNFLNKLCKNGYSQSELENFIERLVKIGEPHIRYNYNRIKNIISPCQNSFRNIALEAITQLFLKANYNNHYIIVDVIKNWNPPIKSENEAIAFLNKLISNRVEQHISLKLRESDPLFSKILNSINYLVRTGNYYKINYLGKIYITETSNSKIDWIVINDFEFHKIPSYLFFDRKTLLKSLFNYIKAETTYFPALPLNEIIFRLKEINQSQFVHKKSTEALVEEIEINETVNSALKYTELKLRTTYYEKNKLDKTEYNYFKQALNMLAADVKNGGLNSNLYTYLHPHFSKLTKESYQLKYHNIFEYLVRLFKNKIAEKVLASKNAICSISPFLAFSFISQEYGLQDFIIYCGIFL